MSGQSCTSRAYTLLELVLVLAIIAATLAMVAPSLSGFARGRRAEEAARQFVSLTRWARSQATTDGVSYQLTVDPSLGQWKLTVQDDTDSFTDTPGPFGRVFSVPEGVEIQAELPIVEGQQTITFDASGRCDTGTLHFIGFGSDITVTCTAPVEVYRILKDNGGQS
jgi:Tfp pilus assembly protein FimT